MIKPALSAAAAAILCVACASAQEDAPTGPQMTIGNGEANAIIMDGLQLVEAEKVFSQVRVDGDQSPPDDAAPSRDTSTRAAGGGPGETTPNRSGER